MLHFESHDLQLKVSCNQALTGHRIDLSTLVMHSDNSKSIGAIKLFESTYGFYIEVPDAELEQPHLLLDFYPNAELDDTDYDFKIVIWDPCHDDPIGEIRWVNGHPRIIAHKDTTTKHLQRDPGEDYFYFELSENLKE